MSGVISRQFKTGSTTNAFYFYNTGTDGVITAGNADGSNADDSAYLLQLANDTTAYTYSNSSAALVRTSQRPGRFGAQ